MMGDEKEKEGYLRKTLENFNLGFISQDRI